MKEEYERGFNDGFQFSIENWNPKTGRYNAPFPETFCHMAGVYNCGFGEGLITGRSKVIDDTFGYIRSISWSNGKAIIER